MTRIHLSLDIRGAIRNRSFHGFTNDDGTPATHDQVLDFLCDQLAKGHKFIPMGKCDGFDPMKGCPGHKIEDEALETT